MMGFPKIFRSLYFLRRFSSARIPTKLGEFTAHSYRNNFNKEENIALVLGGGAHLRNLRRTRVGSFGEDEALPLEEIILQKPIEGMRDFEMVRVDEDTRKEVSYGRVFDRKRLELEKQGPWVLVDYSGQLLAVYKEHGDSIKPVVVIVDP